MVKSQIDDSVFTICGRDICNCSVYLKQGGIETPLLQDTIPIKWLSEDSHLLLYYPNDTIVINKSILMDESTKLYEDTRLIQIFLLDVRNCDGVNLNGYAEAIYQNGCCTTASILFSLKMNILDENLLIYKCHKSDSIDNR
jgi:hypothetical protein